MTQNYDIYENVDEAHISRQECLAMRLLDTDDQYTRSEIAFIFECVSDTVTRHAEDRCHHEPGRDAQIATREFLTRVEGDL